MKSPIPDYLERVLDNARPDDSGAPAGYIDVLAKADTSKLAVAIAMVDGNVYSAGDDEVEFSIQSISKVYSRTGRPTLSPNVQHLTGFKFTTVSSQETDFSRWRGYTSQRYLLTLDPLLRRLSYTPSPSKMPVSMRCWPRLESSPQAMHSMSFLFMKAPIVQ